MLDCTPVENIYKSSDKTVDEEQCFNFSSSQSQKSHLVRKVGGVFLLKNNL